MNFNTPYVLMEKSDLGNGGGGGVENNRGRSFGIRIRVCVNLEKIGFARACKVDEG
jgi:hypothetical protein